MKKTYTKEQIQEAISYWQKQLAKGNYKRLNESDDERRDILAELEMRNDIPNYVKGYISEWAREAESWDIDKWTVYDIVKELKRVRKITVTAYTGKSGPGISIPTNAVPLKVTPQQINDYVQRIAPGADILTVTIDFGTDFRPGEDYHVGAGGYIYSPGVSVRDDQDWCEDVHTEDPPIQPIDMGDDGDATAFWDEDLGVYTVDNRGDIIR